MKSSKVIIVFAALALLSLLFILYTAFFIQTDNVLIDNEEVLGFDAGWQVQRADGRVYLVNLPAQTDAKPNETVTITNSLPKGLGVNTTLALRTTHQTVEVLVNDKPVYAFGKHDSLPFLKSPGTAWHFVQLSPEDAGATITLRFSSPYPLHAVNLRAIWLGTKSACVFSILRQGASALILCISILLFGLVLSLFYALFKNKIAGNASMLYLGCFAVTISLWSLAETQLLQFVFSNVLVLYTLTFLPLMLAPLPMVMFVKETYGPKWSWLLDGAAVLAIVNFVACTALQLLGIRDLAETVTFTHIVVMVSLAAVIISVFTDAGVRRNHSGRRFLIGILVMTTFVAGDFVRYYLFKMNDSAMFFRFGFLAFIIILSADTVEKYFSIAELSSEARIYRRLAYLDILTGLKNRTAFDRDMEKLAMQPVTDSILVVEFDLNNLKAINDLYGHKEGDKNLVAAAGAINASFKKLGSCYRIGGDEFAAVLKGCSEQNVTGCLAAMQAQISAFNQQNVGGITIAYGYAYYEPDRDKDFFETLNRADDYMYKRKHKMKDAAEAPV